MAHDPARLRRATIEDVASAADVSVATVSRALRGLPNVAISTRERVVEVAARLHYTPDPAASRLAVGRTKTVTVVVPNLSGWYASSVVAGVEAVCSEAGYDVLVVGVGSHNDLGRILGESYHLERRTDGLVVVDIAIEPQQAASISSRGVSIATIGYPVPGHPSIRIDNVEVGRIAAAHLTDRGHRRLGMITGMNDDPLNFTVPLERRAGFLGELERRGIDFDSALAAGGNFDIDGGQEAMATLLDHDDPPTGVFSMSDEMAFGAIMELQRRGLQPGVDVAVMGVDDHEFSRVVSLTTVHQSVADHGSSAARLLLTTMQQHDERRDDRVPGVDAGADTDRDGGGDPDPSGLEQVAAIRLITRSTT